MLDFTLVPAWVDLGSSVIAPSIVAPRRLILGSFDLFERAC